MVICYLNLTILDLARYYAACVKCYDLNKRQVKMGPLQRSTQMLCQIYDLDMIHNMS
jgi:hypothetical protein